MCFHSKQSKDAQTLEKRFSAKLKEGVSPESVVSAHYHGFDYPKTPIITNKEEATIQLFNWGLIPSWSKDDSIKQYTLNARIETLDEKPSFRHHQSHRCLVLADGFYEWKWLDPKGKKKQKHEVFIKDHEPFAFAGIWSEWVDKSTGELINTYSIVTTEAQRIMREVHNSKMRMPVVLQPEQESSWLSGSDINDFVDTGIHFEAISDNYQGMLF